MPSSDFVRVCALAIALGGFSSARAEVGTVAAIEGESTRTNPRGESRALQVGSQLGLGDMLEVKSGNLKISLGDESEIVLGSGSLLRIDEAQFTQPRNRSFSAWLLVGSMWLRVVKTLAGSEAKFEVVADRLVASVRGTTMRSVTTSNFASEPARVFTTRNHTEPTRSHAEKLRFLGCVNCASSILSREPEPRTI